MGIVIHFFDFLPYSFHPPLHIPPLHPSQVPYHKFEWRHPLSPPNNQPQYILLQIRSGAPFFFLASAHILLHGARFQSIGAVKGPCFECETFLHVLHGKQYDKQVQGGSVLTIEPGTLCVSQKPKKRCVCSFEGRKNKIGGFRLAKYLCITPLHHAHARTTRSDVPKLRTPDGDYDPSDDTSQFGTAECCVIPIV